MDPRFTCTQRKAMQPAQTIPGTGKDYGHTCSRTIAALSAACPFALRLRKASTAAWHISIVPLTLTFMTVSHLSSKSASGRTFRAVTAP